MVKVDAIWVARGNASHLGRVVLRWIGGGLILAFGKQSTLTVEAIGLREDSRALSKLEPGRYMITV